MAGMRTSSRSNTCPTAWSASWGLSLVIVLLANLSPSSSRAAADTVGASPPRLELSACRLKGVAHEARCGVLKRPLNPAEPAGPQIDVHVAVLPALARNKLPDPVLMFAGGPGQSAIELAGPVSQQLGRFLNRRDLVLIDQRGTGQSAPLRCEDAESTRSSRLQDMLDPSAEDRRTLACLTRLKALPYGDLRYFTTTIAMQDVEAVRLALGLGPINAIGGSYGTRAVLEYQRQFPDSVRRAVIDGVAPPDMVLMRSMSTDVQAAFDALLASCAQSPDCQRRYPDLAGQWRKLLGSLPREVTLEHPITGQPERVTLTRDAVITLIRTPLYAPMLAAALPLAISEAANGRFMPLLGLGLGSIGGGRGMGLSTGMHFSVVCAEDLPRLATATDVPGGDVGQGNENMYRRVCSQWPQGAVPPAFYSVPAARHPVLLLSGSLDPVTPPRHAQRVAGLLGPQAAQVVVPNVGHGVMGLGCVRDVVYRFVDQPNPAKALADVKTDAACAANLPRPPAFVPVGAATAVTAGEGAK